MGKERGERGRGTDKERENGRGVPGDGYQRLSREGKSDEITLTLSTSPSRPMFVMEIIP